MGAEKKTEEASKKVDHQENKEKKKPNPSDNDNSKDEGAKKSEEGAGGGKEEQVAPPPPPDIVLRVYMHCEGCARKVQKSLRGFNGVEDVITDCKNHKVLVKGEKADPMKVVERVQKKSHRHVELLSPIPKPPSEEEAKKPEEKEPPKPEPKKEEPKVKTVVLKVHMHCEACAQEMKKRIERMKDVEVATADLKNSQVTVTGTFDPPKLVDYVYRKTAKHAVVVRQEPDEAKEDGKNKETKDGEKKEERGAGDDKTQEKKGGVADAAKDEAAKAEEDVMKVVELRRNEFFYYPPKYAIEMYHTYPPEMFSDENPNACSIM